MSRHPLTKEELLALGYLAVRQLPDGSWAGIQPMMYTHALMTKLDNIGYETRYCYPNRAEALFDLATWDGEGDPPGRWVKKKGRNVDLLNPRLADDDFAADF